LYTFLRVTAVLSYSTDNPQLFFYWSVSQSRSLARRKMPPKGAGQMPATVAPKSSSISHDNVAELNEAFYSLDSSGGGFVSSAEVRRLFCSIIPSLGDGGFDSLLQECHVDPDEPVTFAQFFVLITTASEKTETDESANGGNPSALYSAFAPFDPEDSGFVDSSVFLYLMGEKGEKLSAPELDELRLRLERTSFMKRGRVNYKGFINNLLATTADKRFL
jgi:Ca2+-binding EF-hand superfamily protein